MPSASSCRRLSLALLVVSLAAVLPTATAHAAYFPADPVDGPSAGIKRVLDLDIARDGSGAVAYLREDAGVDHVFVSRLVNGVFQPPERIDAALSAPATQGAVAVSDGGRSTVAFISGGQLFTVVRPAGSPTYSQPQLLATAASDPSADMSITGTAYVSFTSPGASAADVRAARLPRDATEFAVLPQILDVDGAREAGAGTGRSDVAISADSTGLVVWGEGGSVFARRVSETGGVSSAVQELALSEFNGLSGGIADLPSVDIEDDSSYAWVGFRQQLSDGRAHAFTRRLVGSAFEAPAQVDGFGLPGSDDATDVHMEMSGRGTGLASVSSAGSGAFAALLHDDKFFPPSLMSPGNAVAPAAVGGIGENFDAFIAYRAGTAADASVRIRAFDIKADQRTVPGPEPEGVVSNPAFGPVALDGGFDMGVNRVGDAVAVFVQGSGPERRLVAGTFDRVPASFNIFTSGSKFRTLRNTPLAWGTALDLWGPLTYKVEVDGRVIGETRDTKLQPSTPISDGLHEFRVVATDRRGQSVAAAKKTLRIDSGPPRLSFRLSGRRERGRTLKVIARATDVNSGIRFVRVDFGDGFRSQGLARTVGHAYRRRGTFTIRVSATDRAGNAVALTRRVRIAGGKR